MKWISVLVSTLFMLFTSQVTWANTGLFFNISALGTTLHITTTTPNHAYPDAGIKLDTAGYSISGGCTPSGNGYCLFPVSDSTSADISINGTTGNLAITLCLSGLGPADCQKYTVSILALMAYVVNSNSNTISLCPINSDGTFSVCTSSDANGTLNLPLAIAFNPAKTIAYIINFSNTLSVCPINRNGTLGTCTSVTDPTFNEPTGVALNAAGTYMYLSNFLSGNVATCPVDPITGLIGSCVTTSGSGADFADDQFVNLHTTNGTTYLYTTGSPSQLLIGICPVDNLSGAMGTCVTSQGTGPAPNPGFTTPQGISFNSAGNIAYIGNAGVSGLIANYVSICPVKSDGTFDDCTITNGNDTFNFTAQQGINLFMSSSTNYGYVPNNGNNTVSICPINPNDGSLGTCTISEGNGTFNAPSAVALRSID